jgi:allantoicase
VSDSADFAQLPDIASRRLGGTVMHADDDFFADVHSLIDPAPVREYATEYGPRGKVYDGWETRRRRTAGADRAVLRLGVPALVRGVDIDTSHFVGNYPPFASVEVATVLGYPSLEEVLAARWTTALARAPLTGDAHNRLAVDGPEWLATHVRLTMHPDGGIARFRVHGEIVPDPRQFGGRVDLAALVHGAQIDACSNRFFGSPANALAPGRAQVMSDGWETSRRRDEGNDWLVVRLAAPGALQHAVIDTSRFIGNAPGWAQLTDADSGAVLLPRTRLLPDTEHRFRLAAADAVRRARLDIYPDGGISRLRLLGEIPVADRPALVARWRTLLPDDQHVDESELFA